MRVLTILKRARFRQTQLDFWKIAVLFFWEFEPTSINKTYVLLYSRPMEAFGDDAEEEPVPGSKPRREQTRRDTFLQGCAVICSFYEPLSH